MEKGHHRGENPADRRVTGERLLEVRILSAPPRSPMRTDVFWSLTNSPQFAGVSAVQIPDVRSLLPVEVVANEYLQNVFQSAASAGCAVKLLTKLSSRCGQRVLRLSADSLPRLLTCAFRKSYPNVMVVQPRQDWDGYNDPGPLHCPT